MNVFVGICVDDISNKILHAMCVKWRPIHIIYRGSSDPREERIKWVGERSMKRAIEIVCVCVCKSKI